MGVTRGGVLIAVVAYHEWDPHAKTIQMSAAATDKRWLSRNVLFRMYDYPFNLVGCQLVVKRVAAENAALLNQFTRLGCTFYRIARLRGKDED